MSAVKVIRYLLANNANLIAEVPATKITTGDIPINTVLPAIAVSHISTVVHDTVAMNSTTLLKTGRVQVTVFAKTYPQQATILNLVRKACPVTRATVNGVVVDSILTDTAGPDFYESDPEIYIQSQDFMVRFLETA